MKLKKLFENYSSWQKSIIILFVITVSLQNVLSTYNTSIVWDERCYIGSGKYLLATGNFFDYNALTYHPPLSFFINSIFLTPIKFRDDAYQKNDCWYTGNDIIFNSGHNPFLITFLARLPFIILSVILSLLVLKFTEKMYGIKSAVFSMFLYTFNVTILSNSNLALTDFLVTFFIFLTLYSFWKLMNNYNLKNLFLTGVFFGLAQLSKMTALILVPSMLILAFIEAYQKKLNIKNIYKASKLLIFIFLIGFIVIWSGYEFSLKPLKNSMPDYYVGRAYQEIDKKFANTFVKNMAINAFEKAYIPAPQYFSGLAAVYYRSAQQGREGFFLGKVIEKSVWYYHSVVFILKTQISLLVLIIITLIFFRKTKVKSLMDEFYLVIPILILFAAFTINKTVSGVAHILPAYPFLFVFVGKITNLKMKPVKILLYLIVIHYLLSSILAFPNYYAYFNEFIGSDNGYKYLGGGNLDSGQNLPRLKEFMAANNIKKINLSYSGSVDPKEYGIDYDYMPSPYFAYWVPDYVPNIKPDKRNEDCSKRKGWVAVSASNFQGVYLLNKTCFSWLKDYKPAEKISYSIFVYNITS